MEVGSLSGGTWEKEKGGKRSVGSNAGRNSETFVSEFQVDATMSVCDGVLGGLVVEV